MSKNGPSVAGALTLLSLRRRRATSRTRGLSEGPQCSVGKYRRRSGRPLNSITFKRLKSLIGLKGPPGVDERSAKPYLLTHLLMIFLLESLVDEFEDSPHW